MKAVTVAAARRRLRSSAAWRSTSSRSSTEEPPSYRATSSFEGRRRPFASSSSSAFWDDFVPRARTATNAVRKAVKDAVLTEAVREDSRLWGRPPSSLPSTDTDHTNTSASDAAPSSSTHRPHFRINGLDSSALGMNLHHSAESRLDYENDDFKRTSVDDALSGEEDPLVDLYLQGSTRHWPHLPDTVDPTINPSHLAQTELQRLQASIRDDLIGTDHPVLNQAASYFFQATVDGGKKVRPMMVMLLSRALSDTAARHHNQDKDDVDDSANTSSSCPSDRSSALLTAPQQWQRPDLPQAQRRLAEISELIHTASLFHDDVIDGSDTRRNIPAVHMSFGNKTAILAGDYLLARASICLARLRDVRVVETMSTIIEHLVRGEVMQLRGPGDSDSDMGNSTDPSNNTNNRRLHYYLRKNFYKTASLMANSCKSAALLGHYSPALVQASYQYGKHVGMAFQLVDDVLDFQGSLLQLGKPALADLKAGLATAPVLFAAEEEAHGGNRLYTLMNRKFAQDGDVETAVEMVHASNGIERTQHLARLHAEAAMKAAMQHLAPSQHRDALIHLAHKVVARTK